MTLSSLHLVPRHAGRQAYRCLALLALAMLAGCAETRIRRESQLALQEGAYEQAVRTLEQGVRDHPDSAVLRSGLVQARSEVLARFATEAATLRAEGKFDEAQRRLERARALEPRHERWDALLADLATERRQMQALADAEKQVQARQPETALRVVEQALKDNPRHAGLLQLQRRVELELRQALSAAGQRVLAETRPISLDFRDAPLRTVLDVVSRNSGINFILDRDIRPDTRVTVFLRQSRVEDALDLIIGTNQLAKKVVDPQSIIIYPNTADKQREYQEQIVRVFYLASAEAKGAAAFLRAMLKIRDPFVDERSNMLALRESQENIQLAERLIALYDAGEPEVLLEVEVLEISASRLTELGIKFPDSFSLTPLAPAGASGLTLANVRDIGRDRIGLGVGGLLVNLKREVGDFTTLANPRIRARNKEKAKVLIGDKIPVVTATTGTGGFVSDSVSYLDVGLKLDVEPTVYADDEVAIKVSLEVSSLGSAIRTASGTLAYQIGTRNATTVLRLNDGETQLLAGLISRDDRTSSSRVPGVGDLPVLGRLFSSQQDQGQRTELVLAITPRILRNIRRPDANETELWVGTDALPRLKLPARPQTAAASDQPAKDPVAAAPISGPVAPPAGAGPIGALPVTPVGLGPGAPPVAASAPARTEAVSLQWQGPGEVKAGQTLELKLNVSATAPLRGLPLDVIFDRERLQLVDVVEGEYFRRDSAVTSFTHSVDAAAGRVRIGVLRNQATGSTGQGSVVTLRFKGQGAGSAAVKLEGAQPVSMGTAPPSLQMPPTFVVQVR